MAVLCLEKHSRVSNANDGPIYNLCGLFNLPLLSGSLIVGLISFAGVSEVYLAESRDGQSLWAS